LCTFFNEAYVRLDTPRISLPYPVESSSAPVVKDQATIEIAA